MKTKLFAGILLLAFTFNGFAQKGKGNVVSISLNNVQPIRSGEKITGYYMFYKADKIKGGDYSYRLRILDENAEEVAEKKLISGEYTYLLDAQYNEELLCFKLFDAKEKKVSLRFYNNKAEKVSSKSYEPDKTEMAMLKMQASSGSDAGQSVFPLGNKGFVNVRTLKHKKMGYELKFYPNNKTDKSWKYGSKTTSPILETAAPLVLNEDIALITVVKKKGMMSKDADYFLVGLDPKTGSELFNQRFENSKYEESIVNSFFDKKNNQINLFGFYFPKGEKTMKGQSLGLSMTTLAMDGKVISKKYVSWEKDVSKFATANAKGKLKDIGFVFFHQFIKGKNGNIYGIGEQYKKTVSAGGSAMKALSIASGSTGAGSAAQVTVKDFYFFEFNESFELQGLKVFEKSTSRVQLPAGGASMSPQFLGYLVKAMGGFDFDYLKTVNDGESFLVYYRDYEKRKGEKNKSVCGVISNTDGEYLIDKIDIETEADLVKVLPAQGSNILFLEYFKKAKDVQLNFKKMNY